MKWWPLHDYGVVHDYCAYILPNQEIIEFSCKYFLWLQVQKDPLASQALRVSEVTKVFLDLKV